MKMFPRLALAAALMASAISMPALAETPADQLVVGFSMSNVLTLDPHAITGKETVQVLANVYDGLVSLDAVNRSQVNPDLAESWEIADDNSSITFTLREGAQFASGNPVTAQDVEWSFKRLMSLGMAQVSFLRTHGFTDENIEESFVAEDERTFTINLPRPVDPQIIILTLGLVGPGSVLDSQLIQEHEVDGDWGSAWLNTNSAGSAAFTLQNWQSNELVLLARNPNYWGEEAPMSRIIMRHLPESQTQRLMLERGDIDIGFSLAASDLQALDQRDDVTVQTSGGSGFYYLAVSMEDDKFAEAKVREALRYLIDYEGINNAVLPFYGRPHQRPIHDGFMGVLEGPDYELDIERAKELLAEAGYPDGFSTTLRALSDAPFLNLATAIQGTLAQAGIDAEIITGNGDQIYGAMRERNFELIVGRGGGGQLPHPDSNMRALVYNPDNSAEAGLTNFQGWRTSFFDEELNTLIETALLEGNPEAQEQMYGDIQERFEEVVHAIRPFSEVVDSVAFRSDLENFVLNPSWSTDLSVVSKSR
jgi:peptide/nickel transport system substrate-binding protein